MGAYLTFQVSPQDARRANDYLDKMPEYQKLVKIDRAFGFYDERDIEWAKKENPGLLPYIESRMGCGEFKTSGFGDEEGDIIGENYDGILEIVTKCLERVSKKIKSFKVWSGSCSLRWTDYFSLSQIARFTDGGKRLSSQPADDKQKLIEAMSQNVFQLS